jgi:hypothetical protein
VDRKDRFVGWSSAFAVACVVGGAKFGFADMVVPFSWALALVVFGTIVGIGTLVYAFWPKRKSDDDAALGKGYSQTHSGSGDNRMDF